MPTIEKNNTTTKRHSPGKGNPESLITENIDIWSTAIQTKKGVGRGSSKKLNLYGIKKLRELILELAVRGLLVPQDPNDEPASVLLEKIDSGKELLISKDDEPFVLPHGWSFKRFADVLDFSGGSQPPKSTFSDVKHDGYVQLIQIRDLGPNPQPVYVHKDKVSKLCTNEDIMIGRYGASVGKVFWGKNGAYNVALIKLHNDLNIYYNKFLYNLMLSPIGQKFFLGMSRSAQAGFSKKDIAPKIIPVPPLAEQHRIVAKVDELMALCDQLEQQQENSISAHKILVETLLSALTNAADKGEFDQTWQKIANHFDTLFTTEHSIDQLKQTILQLAVMGKLVTQDPNDEPVSKLLEKISAEKERLIKEKKIKKQKELAKISDAERKVALPNGWELVRLDDICFGITSGSTPPKQYFQEAPGIPYLKVYNIRNQKIDFNYKSQYIAPEYHLNKLTRSILYPGDVVMNIVGPPLGKIAIIPDEYPEWNCNQAIVFFRPIHKQLNRYIYTFLTASTFLEKIDLIGTAGQDNISVTKSRSIIFPMPPSAEQNRIVEKVDKLMTICEELKSRIREVQTTQLHLADAIAEQAIN